ncbi:hypothetical protein IWQ60_003395 [Tieghemiomyces parasiticus]|uniref:Cysteine dioxygenase n=1 Tax=Tieghemiomyces parasiticus TaxID=78921 RepID=A0A9W8AAF4_9FUNG|nr:hypothetical protein IWQ60_003395 [Tieghemiomyces parasiticus]
MVLLRSPKPLPFTFDLTFLVRAIHYELGDGGLDSDHVNVGRIQALMECYRSNPDDWRQYAHFDRYRYTRNLVDDGNGKFNLLILAWGPGQASHCVMKVLDGTLTETQYHWPAAVVTSPGPDAHSESDGEAQGPLCIQKETHLATDAVTYIHDRIGLHRVGNALPTQGSLSLHLYTPPIKYCRSFNEITGTARASACTTFHSRYGVKQAPLDR